MARIRCTGCGGAFPDVAGPVHPYMESCPGCWATYGEVLSLEYGDPASARLHRLTVDAYAVQHPGRPSPQSSQSVAVHLVSLCLVLEHRFEMPKATEAMARAVKSAAPYPWLVPPDRRGSVTVAEVHGAPGPAEHLARVRNWAASAWTAWSPHHGQVRSWITELYR
jgi:hypothetical protein